MANTRMQTVAIVLVSVAVCLCADWTQAQKTIQRQQSSSSNSVYGGYQQQSAAPTKQRPQQPRPQQPQQQQYQSSQSSYTSTKQQFVARQPAAPVARPAQPSYQQEEQQQQSYDSSSSSSSSQQAEADSEPASYGAVAGKPGVDFPNYAQIPKTSFSCDGKPFDGFYPDEEAGCQAYHVCWENRRESFLCGIGTLFNAQNQHCDYWYNVECNKSQEHWNLNRFFGTSTPENSASGPQQTSRGVYSQSSSSQQASFAKTRPQQQRQQQQEQYDRSASASSQSWRGTQQTQQQQSEY